MTYNYKGKTYKAVIIVDGALKVPATYIGQVGRYDLWLGINNIIYFL